MAEPEKAGITFSLVNISSDALGLSTPATTLIGALGRGISAMASFATEGRRNRRQRENFVEWAKIAKRRGLDLERADLSLEQRAELQATFNQIERQANREAIAIEAIEEHRTAAAGGDTRDGGQLDDEWLDRFWQLGDSIKNEDRQRLWGRILSRKARGAGTISARTLVYLHSLSLEEGQRIQRFASVSARYPRLGRPSREMGIITEIKAAPFRGRGDSREVRLPVPNEELEVFGSGGFFAPPPGWAHEVYLPLTRSFPLEIGTDRFELKRVDGEAFHPAGAAAYAYLGVSTEISAMGEEVVDIIQAKPDEAYVDAFTKTVGEWGGALERVA